MLMARSVSAAEAAGCGRAEAGIESENALEEYQVGPALEFPADLAEMRDRLEAEFRVQLQARLVRGVDARHHGMQTARPRKLDERAENRRADTAPTVLGSDVDRVFDRVEIGGPGAERTVARKSRHRACFDPDQDRKVLRALRLEPLPLRLDRARLVIVGRGGVQHSVAVDRQNCLEIARLGFTHLDHRSCSVPFPAAGYA